MLTKQHLSLLFFMRSWGQTTSDLLGFEPSLTFLADQHFLELNSQTTSLPIVLDQRQILFDESLWPPRGD